MRIVLTERFSGKDDSPSASISVKDAKKEKEKDRLLKDPTLLPPHLHMHDRRTSRVDVDVCGISFLLYR